MKNSLFKRVFATVASVPLALSQCLTYTSYAVTNDSVQSEAGNTDSSEKEAYTLKDNLLYIAPEQVESTWYSAFNAELVAIGNKSNENYIAKDTIVNAVLNRAGKYSEKAQLALDMLGEDGIKYTISPTGDITVTGEVLNPDISALMDISKKYSVKEMLENLAEKYNAPGIADIDFSSVDFSGTYEIIIEGSDLADSYKFDVKAKYIANTAVNGKTVFAAGDAADFALAKIEEAKAIAHAAIDAENIPADAKESAKAEFDGKFAKAEKWINKANNNRDKIYTVSRSKSVANMAGVIEALNNYIENGKYSDKIDKVENKVEEILDREINIPSSVTEAMNNSYVADIFDIVMNEINKITVHYDVQISKEDIANFADNTLYNLNASAEAGTYTLTGDFPDDEVADSVKHMVATVEAGDIYNVDNTLATVGFRIYRDPVTTSSTTTSTTTTTETTTTTTSTSETETETTTTTTVTTIDTDDTNTSTETTTTSGTDDTSTSTETTTTADTDDTNTSTETTTTSGTDDTSTGTETTTTADTDDTNTSTETTTTETTGSGTETTTGTVTTVSGSGIVLNGEVKRWSVTVTADEEAGYAFYYSYEEEFEKAHISDVTLNVVYTNDTTEDIKIDFDYASTPKETFTVGDLDFKYNVPIIYTGEQIIDSTGKVVLADGDTLKTEDGRDATFEFYIGYKGDVNFDYKVNAVDASIALDFYARVSTMNADGTYPDAADVVFSTPDNANITIANANSIYDQFAAFLGDVNQENGIVSPSTNRQAAKGIRTLDANDATGISVCYAELSTDDTLYEIGDKALWDAYLNGEL